MARYFARQIQGISGTAWASAVAAMPLFFWAQDSLFSLYWVSGSSMEPSLKHGDIVVVRKADGIWQRKTRKEEDPVDTFQREHQRDLEHKHCNANGVGWLLHKPPMPVVDDIVVYHDPEEYPPKYSIKRVVGLGQQVIIIPTNRYTPSSKHNPEGRGTGTWMRVANPCVPSYSLWVEGDNLGNSCDSFTKHGPISKKLLVGIAEYRVWPPMRISRIGPDTDLRRDPKPYSYWPNVGA